METLKNENEIPITTDVKKVELQKKKSAKKSFKDAVTKKDSSLTKINFEKFSASVKNFSDVVTSSKQRSLLYIYPENYTILDINGQTGRSFRTSRRKELIKFVQIIGAAYKNKNSALITEEIKNFNIWYKLYFRVNDYTIASISHKKGEISPIIESVLNIIKDNSLVKKTSKK